MMCGWTDFLDRSQTALYRIDWSSKDVGSTKV